MLFPVSSLPEVPRLETKQALLLLDFQNDFVASDGTLPVSNTATFLDKLPGLVRKFRSRGDIVWVRTEYHQPRLTLSPATGSYAVLLPQFLEVDDATPSNQMTDADGLAPSTTPQSGELNSAQTQCFWDAEAFLAPNLTQHQLRACLPNTAGANYPDMLVREIHRDKDINITKSQYSAFLETSLLLQLRTRMITHLYVCGSLSNVSVYATVLDAVRHGLEVTLIEDCLGYRSETCHIEALRQMVDAMGASGIDYQELMDDLAGLLGDVIDEEDFTCRFEVSLPLTVPPPRRPHSAARPIRDRVTRVDRGLPKPSTPAGGLDGTFSKPQDEPVVGSLESLTKSESSKKFLNETPEPSPPRKRSTSDLDASEEERATKLFDKASTRRASQDTNSTEGQSYKPSRPRVRTAREQRPHSSRPMITSSSSAPAPSRSTGHRRDNSVIMSSGSDPERPLLVTHTSEQTANRISRKKRARKKKKPKKIVDPSEMIGEGDSKLILEIMPAQDADTFFGLLKESVKWQKMFHRSGEVPRLVAVQGECSQDGADVPIYRHPADESPELSPFDSNVEVLRRIAEALVGHELNHVLIQWYRNGEDNISEHSDKTLDIVRGSSIVNMSLGAQRTMTLRTKKTPASDETSVCPLPPARASQRIPLPHNSLFVLGQTTNQHWLHSIRADKRPETEKTAEELAFDGQRISLTFRHIGTFYTHHIVDGTPSKIWGQGATSKTKDGAQDLLLHGPAAEHEGEAMIRAFGQENHRSSDWDWTEHYGRGFDVINFVAKQA